jgi:hypothetical protein
LSVEIGSPRVAMRAAAGGAEVGAAMIQGRSDYRNADSSPLGTDDGVALGAAEKDPVGVELGSPGG